MPDVPDSSRERRRHVRVQPLPEMPAIARWPGDSAITLRVVDVSVGGVGIWVQRGSLDWRVEETHELELELGQTKLLVSVDVRHLSADRTVVGLSFNSLASDAQAAIAGYVSELTERGA